MNYMLPALHKTAIAQWTQDKLTTYLSDVLTSFLVSRQSECTRRSYLNDLRDFINFVALLNIKLEFITEIDENIIILWHEYLNSKTKLSQTSIRRKLNAMGSLLEFSFQRKLITENPMRFIKLPKIKTESKTNAFTEDEVLKILNFLKEQLSGLSGTEKKNDARSYRSAYLTYVVILMLFSVGMRVNELCKLKIEHVEFSDQFTRLHMLAKGQEEHSPFIPPETAAVLKKYLQKIRNNAKPDDYVFCRTQKTRKEEPLSQVAVYKMIIKTAKSVGIEKKVSPHSCRATLATLLYKQGVPLVQIQNLLNHKDVTTTTVYIKKADELSEAAATRIQFL